MALNALKIQTADLVGKLVAQLSNRPTNSIASGGDNLTAQEVKERYDAYGHLLKDRFNALVDAIVADPSTDTDALANYIKVYLGDPTESDPLSLADALAALVAAIAEKYSLPVGGIPADDLAIDVQTSLGKADTAYQKPASGIPASDLAEAIRTILTNAVSQSEFAPVKALAEGAEKAEAAENYSALASLLSAAEKTAYKPGQKFLIGTYGVPDVGVLSVEDTAVSYTYTTDAAFEASLMAGTLQIGYFVLRPVEGKTNLADYATTADLDALINALVDGVMAVAEASYAESATYAQQADLANQINTDREIEDADTACPPAVFGTVGGNAEVQSGLMPFTELRGNTIKWNQLIPNEKKNGTNSVTDVKDYVDLLFQLYSGDTSLGYDVQDSITTVGLYSKIFTASANADYIRVLHSGSVADFSMVSKQSCNIYQGHKYILSILFTGINTTTLGGCAWDNVMLRDITEIYGSGNEPSTVSEVLASFNLPYYAYNAGTLLSSKSSSVDFVKRNQWDEEGEAGDIDASTGENAVNASYWRSKNFIPVLPGVEYNYVNTYSYETFRMFFYDGNKNYIGYSSTQTLFDASHSFTVPNNCWYIRFRFAGQRNEGENICIYVCWDTPGLPFVPYSKQHITLPNIELRSAGSVYDVLYQQGGGKRRVGTIDLGTLDWYPYGTTGHIFRASLSGHITKNAITMTCAKYECLMPTGNPNTGLNIDKSICALYGGGTNIYVRDDDYDNTVEGAGDIFKAAMDGITLYYGLATETDITLEENPGWTKFAEIDNFGTVKFNQSPAQTIPVPQAYFVRYVVNLVEFLDSLFVHCGGDVSKIALVE